MKTIPEPRVAYDEAADTLYIAFFPGECATGLSLSEHILLRVNGRERRAIGITLVDFSILADRSEIGPRSFPLSRFGEIPPDLQELALELLHSPPISEYLTVSAYSPAEGDAIPIATLNPEKLVARAV